MLTYFQTTPFLATLALSFLVQTAFFVFAATLKTDKFTDLSYGLTFIILALATLLANPQPDFVKLLFFFAVLAWGLRLAGYLFIRILTIKKDHRFDGVREDFFKFLSFWIFQALTVWVVLLPTTHTLSLDQPLSPNPIFFLGLAVWLFGFVYETIADFQKFTFKNQHPDKFINQGLYKYSRHPNYFGEITLWWGLFLAAAPYFTGRAPLTIIGPIFITILIFFVSGIPPLEKSHQKRYGHQKPYQKYRDQTSLLIPLPPQK